VARHASALKRHRQSEKRRERNKALKTQLRHLVREVRASIDRKDAAAGELVARAARALDKAVTKGILHRNAASRKASRLAAAAHAIGARKG
jgi:small subunit ribosomal protein S20